MRCKLQWWIAVWLIYLLSVVSVRCGELTSQFEQWSADFSRHFIRARLVSSSSRPRMECQRKVSSAQGCQVGDLDLATLLLRRISPSLVVAFVVTLREGKVRRFLIEIKRVGESKRASSVGRVFCMTFYSGYWIWQSLESLNQKCSLVC